MKIFEKRLVGICLVSLFLIDSVNAMCTYQNFAPQDVNSWDVITTNIRDTKSKYDTHGQYSYHRQCWNGKSLTHPTIKVTFFYGRNREAPEAQFQPGFSVSSHGALTVTVKDVNRASWKNATWNVEIINQDDNNKITNHITVQCKSYEVAPNRAGIVCH